MNSPVIVTVPSGGDFVSLLRSVTAGVAARLDVQYDTIEDLCLAVDEACAHLLRNGGPASTFTLAIGSSDGAIEMVVRIDGRPVRWPSEGATQGFAWQVLTALVDEASFDRSDSGLELRLRKQLNFSNDRR